MNKSTATIRDLVVHEPITENQTKAYEAWDDGDNIILAGSAGAILLDIDKFMLPQKEAIEYAAYYSVGVYIASVISIPGRAMAQIVQPITAKALNENSSSEIYDLYKSTSINLLLVSGLLFLLINLNINQAYLLIDEKYSQGIWVVLMISIAQLYTMSLGNNGAIISNSKYYKILLPYAIAMALSVVLLNNWFISLYQMNGAALSTLVVLLIFNTVKIGYVKVKFKKKLNDEIKVETTVRETLVMPLTNQSKLTVLHFGRIN